MNFNMLHPADQIVLIMNRIYRYGMTTTSGGNLSIKDDDGVVWISPGSVDKGNLRREDIVRIMPDGTIKGIHKPSSEHPFHTGIYKKRPDIKAVLHAHPPTLVAFSIAREIPDTALIPNAKQVCGKISMAPYAGAGSEQLGQNIANEFAKGSDTVILENHGVCIGAQSLFQAFNIFETLDFCARLQIRAKTIGTPKPISERHLEIYSQKTHPDMEEFEPETYTSKELGIRREMCELIHRAYDNMLFTSGQGTFSCRLNENDFVITPYAKDRKYLEPEDLVRIENGRKEKGALPSRSAILHQEIYKQHPDVKSVILAHPPNIMAFAVTDEEFDSRLIPESYIMLRDVKKFPFGSSFMQPQKIAQEISLSRPAVILENDCAMVVGTDLLNAFDRMEVMEYSAKSVVYTRNIGKIVKISDEEIHEIEVAFNLD